MDLPLKRIFVHVVPPTMTLRWPGMQMQRMNSNKNGWQAQAGKSLSPIALFKTMRYSSLARVEGNRILDCKVLTLPRWY